MWDSTHKMLDTVKAGTPQEIKFKFTPDNPSDTFQIEDLSSSCGCSKPTWLPDTSEVRVIYTPAKVSEHLIRMKKNFYIGTKEITVLMSINGKQEYTKLQFTAKVVN